MHAMLLALYLILVLGWAAALENYAEYITGMFWIALGIAVTIEKELDIMKEFWTGSDRGQSHDSLV